MAQAEEPSALSAFHSVVGSLDAMESLFGKVESVQTAAEQPADDANAATTGKEEEPPKSDDDAATHDAPVENDKGAASSAAPAADPAAEADAPTGGSAAAAEEEEDLAKVRQSARRDLRNSVSSSDQTSTMKAAATKFNIKPKDGINYLIEKGVITKSAPVVAAYLLEQSGNLSKKRIGEYLGNIDDFNQEVLSEFLKEYSFEGRTLVQSLRMILTQFRLPGEAQQIDRILEKFSAQFFATQTEGFSNEDCVYILSFSIM